MRQRRSGVILVIALILAAGSAAVLSSWLYGRLREDSATPAPSLGSYRNDSLGFAARYPKGWRVSDLGGGPSADNLQSLCDQVLFQSRTEMGSYYGVTVERCWPASGRTVTETVDIRFGDAAQLSRNGIETSCCRAIGGAPAIELTFPPMYGYRNRKAVLLQDGWELNFTSWWTVPFQPGGGSDLPPASTAQAEIDSLLESITFFPVARTPTRPPPLPTPAPTSTSSAST